MTCAIEVTTVIDAPPAVVFGLALDMEVHARSFAASDETAVTSTGSMVLGLGDEVTFRARHFGLPWRMTSRVTALDAPTRFVDEQVRGPFAFMRHEHVFAAHGGATRMVDRVAFAAPAGIVGRAVEQVVLRRYLTALVTRRADHLKSIAEEGAGG